MDDKTKPCGDFYLSILNTNSTNLTNKCIPPPAAEIQKSWRKYNYIEIKTNSSKIDFPRISGFREAGLYSPPPAAEIQKSWRNVMVFVK